MSYTIDELDAAIVEISGSELAVRRGEFGWSRPLAMLAAASSAWIAQRPEDAHTQRLRAALLDMNETGSLKPVGGWGDEE